MVCRVPRPRASAARLHVQRLWAILELVNTRPSLPSQPGAYWLVLYLPRALTLVVGRKGQARFPAGWYVYTGSAHGPGGIRSRLGRHLRGSPRQRWHIDYLRTVAQPVAWGWTTAPAPTLPWECRWAQALAAHPAAYWPLPGFGASDCRHRCPAHLVGFLQWEDLRSALPEATRGTMKADCLPNLSLEPLC